MNSSRQMTFKVIGNAMTDDVTLSLNDADGVFTIDPAVISATDVLDGILVTVTFSPDAISDYNAVVTLSSEGAQDVVINLTGHGLIVGYAPVMQPADSTYIGLTQFRAEWTDQTPAENLSSYTLEVSPKPEYQLLETADLSTVPNALENNNLVDISGNYGDYLPAGWSATSYVYAYNNALIMAYNGTITTPIYSFTGYDKLTVVVKAASYYYNNSSIRVSTSLGAQELAIGSDFADYTIVLDCAGVDAATIQAVNNYTSIKQVTVYVGDLTAANVRASEMGDLTYRLITGITDKFYTVDDLQPEGSFIYKVKALFVDGTESDWSNVELVTLFENGHGYAPGDVNHDGNKSISDVTDLIRYLLSGGDICSICADVNGDTVISISDVTALISILLTSN